MGERNGIDLIRTIDWMIGNTTAPMIEDRTNDTVKLDHVIKDDVLSVSMKTRDEFKCRIDDEAREKADQDARRCTGVTVKIKVVKDHAMVTKSIVEDREDVIVPDWPVGDPDMAIAFNSIVHMILITPGLFMTD